MKVLPIKNEETYPWLLEKHYAKRIPQIMHAFGLYDDNGRLVGVVTYGIPASPSLCMGICGKEYSPIVLEPYPKGDSERYGSGKAVMTQDLLF